MVNGRSKLLGCVVQGFQDALWFVQRSVCEWASGLMKRSSLVKPLAVLLFYRRAAAADEASMGTLTGKLSLLETRCHF